MIMRVSAQGQAYGYLGAREQLGSGARFPLLHCPKARAEMVTRVVWADREKITSVSVTIVQISSEGGKHNAQDGAVPLRCLWLRSCILFHRH